jgi:hypothetical protein
MTSPPHPLLLSASQQMRIQVVAGGICERCSESGDPRRLRIHQLPPAGANPEKRILILCPRCDQEIRILPVETRRTWVEQRPFALRRVLRAILGYRPSAYVPPEGPDPAELYRSACEDWCLNGSG